MYTILSKWRKNNGQYFFFATKEQDANLVQFHEAGANIDLGDKESHTCLDIATPSLSKIMHAASTKEKKVKVQ